MSLKISTVGAMLALTALGQKAPGSSAQLLKITLNYPTRTGQSWPLYIAKEGGYYLGPP